MDAADRAEAAAAAGTLLAPCYGKVRAGDVILNDPDLPVGEISTVLEVGFLSGSTTLKRMNVSIRTEQHFRIYDEYATGFLIERSKA